MRKEIQEMKILSLNYKQKDSEDMRKKNGKIINLDFNS